MSLRVPGTASHSNWHKIFKTDWAIPTNKRINDFGNKHTYLFQHTNSFDLNHVYCGVGFLVSLGITYKLLYTGGKKMEATVYTGPKPGYKRNIA